MAKRIYKKAAKRVHHSSHHKTVGYHLKVYFVTVFIGVVVFMVGSFIFPPQAPCANSGSCKSDLTEKIENGAIGIFEGRKVIAPTINIASDVTRISVLGTATTSAEKHIYVDLATQTLYAYEGSTKIYQMLVSSGRWGKTPVGNFNIWEKLRSTRMAGGEGAAYYNLPNVPFTMYFYHDFGLHGAYWHDNFGHTMSHGCVNLRQIDAETLFNWADGPSKGKLGTAVSVCNEFSEPNNCTQTDPVN